MPLLVGADLATYQTLSGDEVVAAALEMIGARICPGVPNVLERAERDVTVRFSDNPRAPLVPGISTNRLGATMLGVWPITGLTQVLENGVDVTAQCLFSRFAVKRDPLFGSFGYDSSIRVRFLTGFTDEDGSAPIPPEIKRAALMTANLLQQNPDGLERERIGRVETTFASGSAVVGSGGLPSGVLALIAPYCLDGFA